MTDTAGAGVAGYGLLAIALILLAKEGGIPVPVPSDLLTITAGIQLASGAFGPVELAAAIAIAVLVGGSAQFLLVRRAGRALVDRVGRRLGLGPERLDAAIARLRRRGAVAVVIGLNLPGARAAVVPAAGLAGMPYRVFAPAMAAGTGLFHGWHVALGVVIGPAALGLFGGLQAPLLAAVAGLAILGLAGWLLLRRRASRAAPGPVDGDRAGLETLRSWTEAACPACLAVAAIGAVADRSRAGEAPSG